MACLSPSTRWV